MASLFSVSLFDWWPFLRPDLRIDRRRAQPPSGLAAGHRRRRRAATLTVASTAPGWRGLGRERERSDGRTWTGTGPWLQNAESTASPCIRSGRVNRSEERRVGEEGRSRWSPDHLKK